MNVVRMIKHTDNLQTARNFQGTSECKYIMSIYLLIIAWNINNAFLFIYLSLFYIFSATMKNYVSEPLVTCLLKY